MLVPVTGMGVSTSSPQYWAENVGELQDISFDALNKHAIALGDKRDQSIFVLARIKDEYMRFGFVNISNEIDTKVSSKLWESVVVIEEYIDKKFNELKDYVDSQLLLLRDTSWQQSLLQGTSLGDSQ